MDGRTWRELERKGGEGRREEGRDGGFRLVVSKPGTLGSRESGGAGEGGGGVCGAVARGVFVLSLLAFWPMSLRIAFLFEVPCFPCFPHALLPHRFLMPFFPHLSSPLSLAAPVAPRPSLAPIETDRHRIAQREKQIEYGKNTVGYYKYSHAIPRGSRRRGTDPETPDARQTCSKRSFDGQIRKWRRALHAWDDYEGEDRPAYPDAPKGADSKAAAQAALESGHAAPAPFPAAPAHGRGGLASFLLQGFKRRRPEETTKDARMNANDASEGSPVATGVGHGTQNGPLAPSAAARGAPRRQRGPAADSCHAGAGEMEEYELLDEEEAGWTCIRAATAHAPAAESQVPQKGLRAA